MTVTEQEAIQARELAKRHPDNPKAIKAAAVILKTYKDEQDAVGKPLFAEEKRARVETAERARRLFTDTETHGLPEETVAKLDATFRDEPDEKFALFNRKFFEANGVPRDRVEALGEGLLAEYSLKAWGEEITEPKAFYDRQSADFAFEDELGQRAQAEALSGKSTEESLAAVEFEYLENPAYKGRETKRRGQFRRAFESVKREMGGLEPTVNTFLSELQSTMGVGEESGPVAMPDDWFTRTVMEIPKDKRDVFFSALAARAGEGEQKTLFQAIGERFGRSTTEIAGNVAATGPRLRELDMAARSIAALGVSESEATAIAVEPFGFNPVKYSRDALASPEGRDRMSTAEPPKAGSPEFLALPESSQVALERIEQERDFLMTAKKINDFATGVVDPAKGSNWYASGLLGIASSAPNIALASGGPVGLAINVRAYQEAALLELSESNPDASFRTNQRAATAVGLGQGLLDMIPAKIVQGKLPFASQWMKKATLTKGGLTGRAATRVGVGAVFEGSQEFAQDVIVPSAVEELAAALDEDVKGGRFKDNLALFTSEESLSELVPMIIGLNLIGAGVGGIRDFKGGWELVGDRRLLIGAGVNEAQADAILEAAEKRDEATAQNLLRDALSKPVSEVLPEARKAALTSILEDADRRAEAVAKGESLGILPAVGRSAEGWTLRFGDGTARTFTNHGEADAARWKHAEEAGLDVAEATRSVIRSVESQIEAGREVAFSFVDERRTLLDATREGEVSREAATRRAGIAEEIGGQSAQLPATEGQISSTEEVDPETEYQEAFTASELAAIAEDDKLSLFQILGSNKTEFADGVQRTTIRLFQGATPLTVIEEKLEGDASAMLANGRRDWMLRGLRRYERMSRDKILPRTDAEVTDSHLKEAWSHLGQSYFVGRSRKGDVGDVWKSRDFRKAAAKLLSTPLGASFEGYARFFRSVWKRAAKLNKMRREGKLDQDLERELARSVGFGEQQEFEAGVEAEAAGLRQELEDAGFEAEPEGVAIEEATDDAPFSVIQSSSSLRLKMTREQIKKAIEDSSDWRDFYERHETLLVDYFGPDAALFQRILSATSQAASVKSNVSLALKAFGQLKRGEEFTGYLPAVAGNLERIRSESGALSGRKIGNYEAAGSGDASKVVVDRHVARMLFGVTAPTKKQFEKAEKVLTEIANLIGWEPRQVQAAIWAASIRKSGLEPESYDNYLERLKREGTLERRIGFSLRGDGEDSVGPGDGRLDSRQGDSEDGTGVSSFSVITNADSRISEMFSPYLRNPEQRLRIVREAQLRSVEKAREWQTILRANRPNADIERERKEREQEILSDKLDTLSAGEIAALGNGAILEDNSLRPILSELTRIGTYKSKTGKTVRYWKGGLMSKSEAKRQGMDVSKGEWDDIPDDLPPYVWGGMTTPEKAADRFGFESVSEFWDAISSEVESFRARKAEIANANARIREIEKEAKAESHEWAAEQRKKAKRVVVGTYYDKKKEEHVEVTMATDRATLIGAMRTLDAMISALPSEIRGKVGGFVRLAQFKTPGAMLAELERRAGALDRELERWLKKEADKGVKKLFETAKPVKDQSGKKRVGKAGADIHDLFDVARQAWKNWTADKAEAHALAIEAEVAKGEMSPEREAHALLEAELVRSFGGWNEADSTRRIHALETATEIWREGYHAYKLKKAAEKERRDGIRADLRSDLGTRGMGGERDLSEMAGVTVAGRGKGVFLSLLNFDQLVTWAFGKESKWARWFADEQRKAENAKLDAVQAVTEGVEDLFTRLAGGNRFKGEALQWRMSRKSLEATAANGDVRKLSELEALSALLMWQQEDGKRHLRGRRDEDGNLVSEWSYDEDFIDEISGKLSSEAWEILGYLQGEYGKEYEPLNAVYREIYGINLPRNPNYSPLLVKPQQASGGQTVDPVTGSTVSGGGFTPGSLRTRAQTSAEPDFRDAVATFIGHKKQIEHWKANARFVLEANAVLGNREVGNSVEAVHGEEATKILRKWLDAIAQGGVRDASAGTGIMRFFERITGNAASMALVGRVGTLAVQSTQLGAAAAGMPTGAYVVRLGKLLTGNLGWGIALASPYIQRRLAQQPVMVQAAMEGLRAGKPSKLKHQVRRIGRLINGADALFTAGTYAMVHNYQFSQARKAGMEPGEADAYAHQEAERIVDSVAQPSRMGTRSFLEVSASNPFMRLAWAFASDARKNAALLGFNAARGTGPEFARAALFVVLLNGLMAGVIRSAWRDLRDEDDDEVFDERYWSAKRLALSTSTDWLFGFPVIGEEIQRAIYSAAGEYTPDGGLLSAVPQAPGAAKNLLEGDSTDVLRDVEKILTAAGLFSDNTAAATSVMHIVRDLYGLGENLIGE